MNSWKRVSSFVKFSTKGITPKYVPQSSIIVLNQKCVRNGQIDYSFAQFTDDTKEINKSKFIQKGDILINSTGAGTAGRSAFVSELPTGKKVIIDSHILILRCNSITEARCLSYLLYSFEEALMSFMTGSSGQSELDKVVLLNIKVKMPNDEVQQGNIADLISNLSEKISLNNRINAELEAMAKTIYDYWFVQFDFPDKNGKPYKANGGKMVWSEELKREIPEGWRAGTLSEIANITMGQSPPGETYNEEGLGTIFFQGSTDFGLRFPSIRKYTTQPGRMANQGDILLSVRAPVGTMNIAKVDCCIGRGLAALNSKDNCIAYLHGVMNNLHQIFERRNTDGTTFGAITKDDLFSLKVVRAPKEILEKFNAITKPMFDKQNIMAEENQKLTELRDWLLPMLMNGQIKIKDAEQELAMAAEAVGFYKNRNR